MNKRHYEHTLPNIRGSLSNTYSKTEVTGTVQRGMNSSSYMKQASCFLSFRDKPRISDFGKN